MNKFRVVAYNVYTEVFVHANSSREARIMVFEMLAGKGLVGGVSKMLREDDVSFSVNAIEASDE